MKKKAIDIILIIWLIIILIDIICAFTISHPIFMLERIGRESTDYLGLGYSMTHRYDGGFVVNPTVYLVANAVILIKLLMEKKRV